MSRLAVPRNIRWPCSILEIAHLCADLRDAERAGVLLASLEPTADRHGLIPVSMCYAGPVSFAIARLAGVCGDLGRADEGFEDAARACAALGARPMRARVLLAHAGLLARLGKRASARERHAEGRALAETLGMTRVVEAAGPPPA